VKRFKFRIAGGATLVILALLFAVGHKAAGFALLVLALVAVAIVAFNIL
jgi:chemotaxis receptor (MCP) glutamine deamidase CheD